MRFELLARYKPYSCAQGKFIPIHSAKQILHGAFEYTLNHFINHELDLALFDERFRNDTTSLRSPDFIEDRPLCLLAGHRLQPQD